MDTLLQEIKENKAYLLVVIAGLAMALYQMTATQVILQAVKAHLNTHLGFCLLLVYLGGFATSKNKNKLLRFWPFFLAVVAFACTLYVQILWPEIENRAYFNSPLDLVVGVLLVFLVLEATRRDFGWVLPVLTLLIVLYPFVGKYFPEPFRCQALDWDQTISNLSIGLQNGIYGIVLPTSANYIFLFVLFGALLQALGGTKFFMLLAKMVAGRMQGGTGIMAVVSSSLVGSITGSAAANVAITGSFTIPLMKKVGYKAEHAAAIEAAASNGGQIMPPIMGIVAFGMAGITGIPYITIISMALIPALLYFWGTGLYVYFRAGQLNISGVDEQEGKIHVKELLLSLPSFIGPFVVILFLLIKGYSVMYVAFWAIICSIVISLLKKDRPSLDQILQGFVKGARAGAGIGASAACVGLIMATVTMSGLGVKLSSGIQDWSGGLLFPALIIIAVICVVMGCGGPSLTAYFIVSMFAVPALRKMGVGFEQAHFFTMFFAVFAFLTPPVAVVAMIAAKLAGASYIKSAVEATKAAIGGFIIPFMFIYCPVMLLQPQDPLSAGVGLLSGVLCMLVLEIAFVGYFLTNCSVVERLTALAVAVCLMLFFILNSYLLFMIGIAGCGIVIFLQWRKKIALGANPLPQFKYDQA